MDFASLPDTAFLQIFRHLSLKDQIRSAAVDTHFRRISSIAVSETKSIDLSDELFSKINNDQFTNLINRCFNRLEKIKFSSKKFVPIFANFSCSHLIDLDLADARIGNDIFANLLRQYPNLISLKWFSRFGNHIPIVFPDDVILVKLETFKIRDCNERSVRSLRGRFPNLKNLQMVIDGAPLHVLDEFFSTIPKLERLNIQLINNAVPFENLPHFWKLSLTSLSITMDEDVPADIVINDNVLLKISRSFPNLQKLCLYCGQNVTKLGIGSLAGLEYLEGLGLFLDDRADFMLELGNCTRLQVLELINSTPDSMSVGDLLNSLPNLRRFKIRELMDNVASNSLVDASEYVFPGWSGSGPRHISFVIANANEHEYELSTDIWKSEAMENALEELEDGEGMVISVKFVREYLADEAEADYLESVFFE